MILCIIQRSTNKPPQFQLVALVLFTGLTLPMCGQRVERVAWPPRPTCYMYMYEVRIPVFYYFKIIATGMLQVLEIYAAMCVMSCGCVICEAGRDLIRVLVRKTFYRYMFFTRGNGKEESASGR